uniref:PH domain-containing protein n=1 Tax=Pygocentrus nattereri TaxID=42514 RepID=A0AAR2LDN6_PYGNA
MAANRETPCRKFQANMFNKSKCQNCFKPRDAHLLSDEDFAQAKPIYGGWLLLAPEGTNFDNPLHRSRKWQRRFFLLYEHGLLRYALDDMASTLPQGTINLNVCVDVVDGESATGQKHSLCISTPEKEHYIRAESREVIIGWQEALIVFPRTNKQNQKKKRKVEPPTPQVPDVVRTQFSSENTNGYPEPGPAKVAVTSSSSLGYLSEERWTRPSITTSRSVSCLSQHSEDSGSVIGGRKPRVESGYFSLEKAKPEEQQPQQLQEQQQPPQHLPLSSSSSSSSSRLRYSSSDSMLCSSSSPSLNTHSTNTHATHTDAHTLSPPDTRDTHSRTLRSSLSSSQSSLDSEPGVEGRGSVQVGGATTSTAGSMARMGRGGRSYAVLADVPRARRLSHREAFRTERKRQELRERTRSPGREEVERLFGHQRRRSQVIERFETQQSADGLEHMDTTCSSAEQSSSSPKATSERTGRSERRLPAQKQDLSLDASTARSVPDVSGTTLASYRRAKSLDRRVTESSMTPDLLNFKKGWMTKLYEDGLWKKHWFVLTDQSLRYYRDSIAEEAADLDGEIDLSTCFDVTEFPVQRNYGFQIHSKEGLFTLSAMTSGIRRNWIQAIMKSVRPTITPDVTRSLPEEQAKARATLDLTQPTPDVSHASHTPKVEIQRSCEVISDSAPPPEQRKNRARDRRREGRSKTFDWAEFHPGQDKGAPSRERAETLDVSSASSPSSISSSASSPASSTSSPQTSSSISAPIPGPTSASVPGPTPSERKLTRQEEEVEEERTKRGQDRRRRFHPSSSLPPSTAIAGATITDGQCKPPVEVPQDHGRMEVDSSACVGVATGTQAASQNPDVQVEIEQRWHQVETTPLREEKQVPITGSSAHLSTGDGIPPQELAALLDKELGQTQRELVRLQEQNSLLQEQLQDARGREQSAREGYVLQETCERGFAAMEETHQKVIEDLQRQHQREINKLLEERERLLEEETNATIAAIEAMKNAHREELEKTQRAQLSGVSADIEQLRMQYEEELQSIHRELEVLSEQYSQKCLENAHLAQALEAERQALQQCQRENQQLHAHNQELNNRLTVEITRMRSCLSGEKVVSPLTQGKDLYELEVLLRIKESEIQYLKQEINSLKDELQSALRDKKYASDKYKDIYTELSIVRAKADCDISKLREKLLAATEALGERDTDGGAVTPGYDIMKSKSNPDFLKKERSALSRQVRGVRSKSLKEGLTVQERMKLFEAKDSRKI